MGRDKGGVIATSNVFRRLISIILSKMKKSLLLIFALIGGLNIIHSQENSIWGTLLTGGKYENGGIFKLDSLGKNSEQIFEFYESQGSTPDAALLELPNGEFIGTTSLTIDRQGEGLIFKYNREEQIITKLFDFKNTGYIEKAPRGRQVLGSNGKVYGISGGASSSSNMYEFDLDSNLYSSVVYFGWSAPQEILNSKNGNLFFTVQSNDPWTFRRDALFEFDPTNDSLVERVFFNGVNGEKPIGKLLEKDSLLYGVTAEGGSNNKGILFSYNKNTQIAEVILEFDTVNLKNPQGSLSSMSDSVIFGSTTVQVTGNYGGVFSININSREVKVLLAFDSLLTGFGKNDNVLEYEVGKLAILNEMGSTNNEGKLLLFDVVNNQITHSWNLDSSRYGTRPVSMTFSPKDTSIYFACNKGGRRDNGTIVRLDLNHFNLSRSVDFRAKENGSYFTSRLALGSNGKLYG